MKTKTTLAAVLMTVLFTSCTMKENPLLSESDNPFGAYAFDKIKVEDYKPAFEKAIGSAKADIAAIVECTDEPTFENTVEALEFAGRDLSRVSSIFYALNSACTSPEMQKVAEEISPAMTEYSMSIILNEKLFARIKAVYEKKESLNLTREQAKLLEDTFKSFSRNGANLDSAQKAEYARVSEELSLATLKFGQNSLAATNAFTLNLTDEADLEGLPDFVKEAAESEAVSRNEEGWTITLNAPSYGPFLKYSTRRDLREKIWKAYNSQAVGGEFDNCPLILKIAQLRTREANILGYPTYAAYALEERMAKNQETVNAFLSDLMEKSLPAAAAEVATIQKYAEEHGFSDKLQSWDFSYWANRYKEENYSISDELLKPYFLLDNVQAAIFDLAGRLYGLKFIQRDDIPVYHPDVRAFEVTDENGRFMALFYLDFFPRDNKRSGAWMTTFRDQSIRGGVEERPFVTVVTNFTKPTENTPSLLTFDEVTTILHEFGHALHGMLAEGSYPSLTGTSVARDFVELPSQIMENWAYEPEYLRTFAKHYQSGEVIPDELIEKIVAAKNFNAGYAQVRQLNFGTIDMAWHSSPTVPSDDPVAFEQQVFAPSALFPAVEGCVMTPSFTHIFSGGYAAGYYSYKWAEVLEADAFSLFKEKGIFNREVADSFRREILSRGSIEEEAVIYRNFRGRDPQPEALLEKLGLK